MASMRRFDTNDKVCKVIEIDTKIEVIVVSFPGR